MGDAPLRGRLMWFELLTKDLQAAEKFYTSVVGWTITPFAGAGMPYSMFTRAGGVPIGGAMTLLPDLVQLGVPPHWGLYAGVEKLEAAAAGRGPARGRRIVGGDRCADGGPDAGRCAIRRAPPSRFTSRRRRRRRLRPLPELGDVSWDRADDHRRRRRRCSSTATCSAGNRPKQWTWGRWASPHVRPPPWDPLGGMMNKSAELAHVPPNWGLYFRVPDLDAAVERVKAGRRPDPQRADGGAWRRSDRELPSIRRARRSRCTPRRPPRAAPSLLAGVQPARPLTTYPACPRMVRARNTPVKSATANAGSAVMTGQIASARSRSCRCWLVDSGDSLRLLKFSGGSVDDYAICRSS